MEEFMGELDTFLAIECPTAQDKARMRDRGRLRLWRAERRDIRYAIAEAWQHEPDDRQPADAPTKHIASLIRDYRRVYETAAD
jgi:hypothetical protein